MVFEIESLTESKLNIENLVSVLLLLTCLQLHVYCAWFNLMDTLPARTVI